MSDVHDLRERLRRLPKPELHVHALGALRPATVVELARKRGAAILPQAERGAEAGYAFADLPAFVEFFIGLFEVVVEPEDFERVTYEILEDHAAQGVRYAELRYAPTSHLSRGATEDGMFAGIEAGARAAREAHSIESRVVVAFPRSLPVDVAREALGIALRQRVRGVVAIDIAGDERAVAADPVFAPIFEAARAGGLGATAHAGEAAGPQSVRGALDLYGVRRIGHGTRAAEDGDLVARLARDGILLEVCPSSNVALDVVPGIAEHPLPRFLAAGVRCTLSTDDPSLFGTDLLREHALLHLEAGLALRDLARMAACGFEAAFARAAPGAGDLPDRLDAWRAEALRWGDAEGGLPSP